MSELFGLVLFSEQGLQRSETKTVTTILALPTNQLPTPNEKH